MKMDAYGKRVLARLQGEGLKDIGEEVLKKVFSAACDELVVEVENNDKGFDDYFAQPIKIVKDYGLKMLDKVDGKEG